MARINIEERWWNDPRRRALRNLLKRDAADQVVVNAWRLGYDYWMDRGGCSLIPGTVFIHVDGYQELIEAGLAIVYLNTLLVDSILFRTQVEHIPTSVEQDATNPNIVKQGSIYLAGTRDSLLNLTQNRLKNSAAGKVSAQKRLLLYGTTQPLSERETNASERSRTSSSVSSSSSSSNSVSRSKYNNVGIRTDYPPEFNELWELYGRRGDKKEGLQAYQGLKLNPGEVETLKQAIKIHVGYTELQFRKHFGRFLKTDWREELRQLPLPAGNGSHPKTKDQIRKENNDAVFQRALEQMKKEAVEKGEIQ